MPSSPLVAAGHSMAPVTLPPLQAPEPEEEKKREKQKRREKKKKRDKKKKK